MAIVNCTSGIIGPRHDPYGWQQVEYKGDDGVVVSIMWCGLRGTSMVVNGVSLMFGEDLHAADALFLLATGISTDDVISGYDAAYEEDPMGPASRYE